MKNNDAAALLKNGVQRSAIGQGLILDF